MAETLKIAKGAAFLKDWMAPAVYGLLRLLKQAEQETVTAVSVASMTMPEQRGCGNLRSREGLLEDDRKLDTT